MVFHIFLDPCDQHGAKGHFPGDFQFALTFFITLHCCDTVHMQSRTSETDLLSVNANQSIHIKIKESSEKNHHGMLSVILLQYLIGKACKDSSTLPVSIYI